MRLVVISLMLCFVAVCQARNVTIRAVDQPAPEVVRSIAGQTGKNFVYPSELLRDMRVSVDVADRPLKEALAIMFGNTEIEWKIKGRNIILKRRVKKAITKTKSNGNRLRLVDERDVLKALQMQPGISGGAEGMAEMHVHGGNADENLFMLDNVPLYQVNHFAGLFSAFNVDAVRYIDFFKSSIPAKYDGRLSSYLDVRTKNGSHEGHHGSFRLGLTSGAFNIDGPVGRNTSYSVALRRSWFDVLSIPLLALSNASSDDEKIRFRYAFMDFNGKISHRFNNRATGFVNIYFGNDILKTGSKDKGESDYGW